MKNLDFTGLDAKKVEKVVKELNQLLADFQYIMLIFVASIGT